MVEARVYQCPVCGAFAQEGDRNCRHCQSLLATVRCPSCFGLSFPGDLHCHGCGAELGLVPSSSRSDQQCPDCKLPLHTFASGVGQLLACERCGGQMVTHALLRALIEQREALGRAVPTPADAPRGNPLAEPVRYRACPTCDHMMNRKNFGGVSGIVVDVCAIHGTFFDAGELPRVLEFVRRGGLAKAHTALQAPPPMPSQSLTPALASPPTTLLDDLVGLVSYVVHVLKDE